jgi:hypothetical protein
MATIAGAPEEDAPLLGEAHAVKVGEYSDAPVTAEYSVEKQPEDRDQMKSRPLFRALDLLAFLFLLIILVIFHEAVSGAGHPSLGSHKRTALRSKSTAVDKKVSKPSSCSEFDDDTTYTADVCSEYDTHQCYTHRRPCNSSYYCSSLCGDACEVGAGAICYYEKISNLVETCEVVDTLRRERDGATRSVEGVEGGAEGEVIEGASDEAEGALAASIEPGEGYGLHDDLRDEGCGMHVYCGYCTGDCATTKMEKYLLNNFGGTTHQPFAVKEAVEHMLETCRHFGLNKWSD